MNNLTKPVSTTAYGRLVTPALLALLAMLAVLVSPLLPTSAAFAQEKPRIATKTSTAKPFVPQSTMVLYAPEHHRMGETHPGGAADGNLNFKVTNGEAEGYAFIKQILPLQKGVRELPYVMVEVTPEEMWPAYWDWVWEVKSPSDNQLEYDLSFKWYGQASCPGNLTSLTLSGPGGSLSQNPLTNPIWGYFTYQSFDVDTPKNICLDWAKSGNCDFTDPGTGCPVYETFIVTGGTPQAPSDMLHLKASCDNNPVADEYDAPIMELRCIKVQ